MLGCGKIKYTLVCLCASCLLAFSGCTPAKTEPKSIQTFAMDTLVEMTVYGEQADAALAAASQELQALDALFDATDEKSEVWRINHQQGTTAAVDARVLEMIAAARETSLATDGAFDISVYPLVCAWGFPDQKYRVPSDEEIADLVKTVDYKEIVLEGDTVQLRPGMQIDLGGIAKGYTSAQLIDLFSQMGVSSALISLGGNVQVLGSKPDGQPWKVAIQDPQAEGILGTVLVSDTAVITAGSYQRYFSASGQTYHHILNPATGYPANSGLLSVTVVSKDAARADALSTALFVLGLKDALDFYRDNDGFEALFVTDDGRVVYTDGLAFTPTDGASYSFIANPKGE